MTSGPSNPPHHYEEALRQKLAPETIRTALMRAGIFLAGWELLKAEVVGKVKTFYLIGFDENGHTYSPDYDSRVLARHKSRFEASLLWLVESNALSEEQAQRIRNLRDKRNEVAHELPRLLIEPEHDVETHLLLEMRALLGVLGRFWGRIEVDIDPDFDGVEVDDGEVRSGVMLLMDLLLEAASELPVPAGQVDPTAPG